MPMDPYSVCPGGTGKKIKFCCSDLTEQLQKIERMIAGDQHVACLKLLEQLEQSHPNRACLLASKTLVLRLLDKFDEVAITAQLFVENHPDNPIALAEVAMAMARLQDGRAALNAVLRAIRVSGDSMHGRVYEAIGVTSRVMAIVGHVMAARALCLIQLAIRRDDQQALNLLMQLNAAPEISLLIKDDRALESCPAEAPFQEAFAEALTLADRAHWVDAAERFEALAQQAPDVPAIWRNLAMLHGWIADIPACVEAMRKYASLDVPLENAVEAEALAMVLSPDPLGDEVDILLVTYPVTDADALEAAIVKEPRVTRIPNDQISPANDGPPPKAVFYLCDRPDPDLDQELPLESMPRIFCQAALFDRQTDQPARLVLPSLISDDVSHVHALLTESIGDYLDGEPQPNEIGRLSASRELFSRVWRLPKGVESEVFRGFVADHLTQALLEIWPDRPLGVLDGKTPSEVASISDGEGASDGEDASDGGTAATSNGGPLRVKLLAAILLLEGWIDESGAKFDVNRLRERLGLPELSPIDPVQTPPDHIPLTRLARMEIEKLSDNALVRCFVRALMFGVRRAVPDLARAVYDRPSLAQHPERARACRLLIQLAEDTDESLRLVAEGRKIPDSAGNSCASWDLQELMVRFTRQDATEVFQLINHVQQQHINEPGVAEAFVNLLTEFGILNPDGTPAEGLVAPGEGASPMAAAGQETDDSGKLWTPDSQKPASEKGKIWTPGMD